MSKFSMVKTSLEEDRESYDFSFHAQHLSMKFILLINVKTRIVRGSVKKFCHSLYFSVTYIEKYF